MGEGASTLEPRPIHLVVFLRQNTPQRTAPRIMQRGSREGRTPVFFLPALAAKIKWGEPRISGLRVRKKTKTQPPHHRHQQRPSGIHKKRTKAHPPHEHHTAGAFPAPQGPTCNGRRRKKTGTVHQKPQKQDS